MVLNVVGSSPTGHPKRKKRSFGLFFSFGVPGGQLFFLGFGFGDGVIGLFFVDDGTVVELEESLGLAQDLNVFAEIPK